MVPLISKAKRLLITMLRRVLRGVGIRRSRPLHRPTLKLRTAHHGSEYGGWTLYPKPLSANSIIYSFGIGEDASFDRAVMKSYQASLFAFDPTPRSIQWVEAQQWPAHFSFHPYGIAARDGTAQFYPPSNSQYISHSLVVIEEGAGSPITVQMLRLETIAQMLGHSQIDLLKMDIEGAEYQVIPDILSSSWLNVRQILVEFHHFFPPLSPDDTNRSVQQLLSAGYELYHVAPSGKEYSFIKNDSGVHDNNKRTGNKREAWLT